MTPCPKPPKDYDENPLLGADFFARSHPAAPGAAARLGAVLERILKAMSDCKSQFPKVK